MTGPETYRVWETLERPLGRAHWWLIEHHLLWPGKRAWLRKVTDGLQRTAEASGVQLVGDPVVEIQRLDDGRVMPAASALATGPPGLAEFDQVPIDVVDRDEQ